MRISPTIHSFQPGDDGSGCSIYDAVMGEPTATITLLKTLIQEWHPHAKTVLELAVLPLDMVDNSFCPYKRVSG